MHVTAFLKSPEKHETGPVVVLFGPERHLRQAAVEALSRKVFGDETGEDSAPTRFPGKETDLKTVLDELLTVSMWGDQRLVVVEEADDFVSNNRAALERYVDKPSKKSVLVLDVKSWPKTTRLAKAVAKIGLELECAELKGGELLRWLAETARDEYQKQLTRDAATLMVELAGTSLGLLEQELAKLASYVGDRPKIDIEDVSTLVGGWRAETTWVMLDALQEGDLGTALAHLDKLLTAGEAPQMILGGIIFVFRKFAQATELSRKGVPLPAALKQAGVFPHKVNAATDYLKRIGRSRAERIYAQLVEADARMKGGSRISERVQLEKLLVDLGGKFPLTRA